PVQSTYVYGWITGLDNINRRVNVRMDSLSATYDESYVKAGIAHMSLLDSSTNGRLKYNTSNFFRFDRDSTIKTGDRLYSLKASGNFLAEFEVGDRFVDVLRNGGAGSMCYID